MTKQKIAPPAKLKGILFLVIAISVFIGFIRLVGPVHYVETIIAIALGVVLAEICTKYLRSYLSYMFKK